MRSPSLNALRALEAVAHTRSFKRAAEELFVTPAAITHQIKQLEEQLGFPLFERRNPGIELTAETQLALPQLREAFETLEGAVASLKGRRRPRRLVVGASPTLASRWLIPRLGRFLAQNPDVDVRVSANSQAASAGYPRDLDLHFTDAGVAGENVGLLFRIEVVPMCHPRLLTGPPALTTPADLRLQTLLHGDGGNLHHAGATWERWLSHAQVEGVDATRGVRFDHSSLALDAAADGLGVTLAAPVLASAEIAAGNVVIAFPIALPLQNAYYVVASSEALDRPEVARFYQWLLLEAGVDAARMGHPASEALACGPHESHGTQLRG